MIERVLGSLLLLLLALPTVAEHHGSDTDDLYAAIETFGNAYATNDVDTYFGFYANDATVYFYGARQDLSAYHEMWTALIESGGGVELDESSDRQVQIMPSGDVAISTAFVDNRTRYADGTRSTARAFETDVWQKIDGKWKIVSLHYSEIAPEE